MQHWIGILGSKSLIIYNNSLKKWDLLSMFTYEYFGRGDGGGGTTTSSNVSGRWVIMPPNLLLIRDFGFDTSWGHSEGSASTLNYRPHSRNVIFIMTGNYNSQSVHLTLLRSLGHIPTFGITPITIIIDKVLCFWRVLKAWDIFAKEWYERRFECKSLNLSCSTFLYLQTTNVVNDDDGISLFVNVTRKKT